MALLYFRLYSRVNDYQKDGFTINDNLAYLSKVHGDLATDIRLDLPDSPIRLAGMLDQHARLQNGVHI